MPTPARCLSLTSNPMPQDKPSTRITQLDLVEQAHGVARHAASAQDSSTASSAYRDAAAKMNAAANMEENPERKQTMLGHVREWRAKADEVGQLGHPPVGLGAARAAGGADEHVGDGEEVADL